MKTRQAVLVEPGRFEIHETDVSPAGDKVLVKCEGSGLCTWELNHWAGRIGKPPMPLGHEGWGTVAEMGPEVSDAVAVGDRVTGLGGACFADYFLIPEPHLMPLRDGLGQSQVPGEPLYCVQNVLRAAHPEIEDYVAVIGCGPMGLWAAQGLASPNLAALVAIDIDDRKLELARGFGATHTINPKSVDAAEAMGEITSGRGADVIVEGTGTAAGVQSAIDLLRPRRARLVIMSSFKHPETVDLVTLCAKAVQMVHAHPGIATDVADGCRRTALLINNGVFKTDALISHRFPLTDINQAFECLEHRPDGYLKGIVVP